MAPAAPGSAVEITVRTVLEGMPSNARVEGSLHAEGDEHKLEAPFTSGVDARLDLEPGLAWKVKASAEGFWSPEEIVVPSDRTDRVTLELHPVGVVTGTLAVAGQDELPDDLQVKSRFRSVKLVKKDAQSVEGTVDCTVRDADAEKPAGTKSAPRLECRVPAGKLALRIRASGYVSHYFWDRTLEAGEELDLGKLVLRPGASVVGWVETSDEASLTDCEVELVPQLVDSPSPAESARASILKLDEKVDERGFFHFAGIVPGSYSVTARLAGYSPAVVENLVVLENAEAELQDPLVLERPLDLTVRVRPSSDPSGGKWGVMLMPSAGGRPRPTNSPLMGFTDAEGAWTGERLESGQYLLHLMDSRGSTLKTEFLDLTAERTTFIVEVPFVEVTGRITLGDEPLKAKVFIGGVSGAVSVSADSDVEGEYSAVIPERDETWEIDVTAKSPRIFSRMRDVEIEANASGEALLDIELPDTCCVSVPMAGNLASRSRIDGRTGPSLRL